jgi:hypothetical protein
MPPNKPGPGQQVIRAVIRFLHLHPKHCHKLQKTLPVQPVVLPD